MSASGSKASVACLTCLPTKTGTNAPILAFLENHCTFSCEHADGNFMVRGGRGGQGGAGRGREAGGGGELWCGPARMDPALLLCVSSEFGHACVDGLTLNPNP